MFSSLSTGSRPSSLAVTSHGSRWERPIPVRLSELLGALVEFDLVVVEREGMGRPRAKGKGTEKGVYVCVCVAIVTNGPPKNATRCLLLGNHVACCVAGSHTYLPCYSICLFLIFVCLYGLCGLCGLCLEMSPVLSPSLGNPVSPFDSNARRCSSSWLSYCFRARFGQKKSDRSRFG